MRLFALAFLLLSLLPSLALADNPSMGPWGVWSTSQALRLIRSGPAMDLTIWESHWQTAMRDAGICSLLFRADGSGVQLRLRRTDQADAPCEDGPVISFPEFRRRMEAP